MLEARARSARDLRRRLIMKGEPEELVDQAIARLTELRYLDDPGFARLLARSKIENSGWSTRRLRQEMWKQGVDRATAEDALREVGEELSETRDAALERLARKRAAVMHDLPDDDRRRRLTGFLARRGYEINDVKRVVDLVMREG